MLYNYTIKNNIVLFYKGPFSNWYGAYSNQKNGQLDIVWDTLNKCLYYEPKQKDYMEQLYRNISEQTSSLKDIHCNCSEQAMMLAKAIKFDDPETAEKIVNEKDPKEQKALGRQIKNYVDAEWAKCRFEEVYNILIAKFKQNPLLKQMLCRDYENYIIAEASPVDKIWGIGLDENNKLAWDVSTWQGENLLGKALMKVRDKLNGY